MTKRILYLVFFCGLVVVPAHAQLEFAPIGAEWVYNNPVDADNIGYNPLESWESYKCTGDSTIGNQVFRKVGELLFLQQGEKIYLWREGVVHLIYDFGLEIGDTIGLSVPICLFPNHNFEAEIQVRTFILDTITTLTVNGLTLRIFGFLEWYGTHNSPAVVYEYIEKIGNPQMFIGECPIPGTFLFPWLRCYKDSMLDYKSEHLLSFNVSDCYYLPPSSASQPTSGTNIRPAPNPVTDLLTIELSDQRITHLIITDISGKMIYNESAVQFGILQIATHNWPKGIYMCRANVESHWLVWKVVK